MPLYLLKRESEADYNQDEAMLIRANSEEQARIIASSSEDSPLGCWTKSACCTCEPLSVDGNVEILLIANRGA